MAIKTYNDQNFVAIANAIRAKNGETTQYKPSEMAAAISALETALEILPQDTVSGAIANFPDGSNNYPVVELIANIDPKQAGSGDPSPSNVRPISGSTECNIFKRGKNLLENTLTSQTVNGTTFTVNEDKSITISGTPTSQTRVYICAGLAYTVKKPSFFSFGSMPTGTRVFCTKVSGGTTTYPTISPSSTASTIGDTYSNILLEVGTTFNGTEFTIYPQVEVGSTATDYEPYQAETKTISWESEAGTVYGGTLNVTTGELTVTYGIVKISDLTWQKQNASGRDFFIANIREQEATNTHDILCDNIAYSGMVTVTAMSDKSIAKWQQSLRIYDTDISDVTTLLNTYGDGNVIFYYKDISKIVYQLTAEEVKTLLGVNNIYADTGDVEVTYRADIDLYIAKKIAEGA